MLLGHGFWVIEEKATGKLIGEIGLMDAKRDIDPPFGEDRELGWALLPEVHGRGYATEALQAVLDWEHEVFNAPCLVALIDRARTVKPNFFASLMERVLSGSIRSAPPSGTTAPPP